MGISDTMLAVGCALHVDVIHGEQVLVLDGPDIGKKFRAVRENDSDLMISDALMPDRRAKRVLRFIGKAPSLIDQGRVKTEDGKIWRVTVNPQDGYLSTDYSIMEITSKDA